MRFYALSNVTAFINDVEMFQKGDYFKKEKNWICNNTDKTLAPVISSRCIHCHAYVEPFCDEI